METAIIHRLKFNISQAYLVLGEKPVLIDSASPHDRIQLLSKLADHGITPKELSLVVHTHGHPDHVGGTSTLRLKGDVTTAMHPDDRKLMQGGRLSAQWFDPLVAAFGRSIGFHKVKPFEPDIALEEGMRLDEWGLAARVLHTPGHTTGSCSILLDSGEAFIGDALLGGWLFGLLFSSTPYRHFIIDDAGQYDRSLRRLLDEPIHTLYLGHGGPISMNRLKRRIDRITR